MKFEFDGQAIDFRPGQTVAAALTEAGVAVVRYSRKLGDQRGPFCGIGNCWECLVELPDGNSVRSCRTQASEQLVLGRSTSTRLAPDHNQPAEPETLRPTVAIVGAGPAGLSAARTLASAGIGVLLIDQEPGPGGQLYRKILDRPENPLNKIIEHPLVDYRASTSVWAAEPGQEAHTLWCTGQTPLQVFARYILIATGATEFTLPFPGWGLPGVMSAGAAQVLTKTQGVGLRGTVVVAGSGPFLLPVASSVSASAENTWLIDSGSPLDALRPQLASHPEKAIAYLRYHKALRSRSVSIRRRHVVIEALGDQKLEAVRVAPLQSGSALISKAVVLETRSLAISHGFVPNLDLALNLNCEIAAGDVFSGVVAIDESQLTSTARVYAAGESTGIGGGPKAIAEGRLAAIAIASELSHPVGSTARLIAAARARRAQHFATFLGRVSAPMRNWESLLTPETLICRCEDVSAGEIAEASALGASDCRSVKAITRCGMGLCQGRTCGPILQAMIDPSGGSSATGLQKRSVMVPISIAESASFLPPVV